MSASSTRERLSIRRGEIPVRRTFIGPSPLRLRVVATEHFMAVLPNVLRELNYVEAIGNAPLPAARDIWLVDGALANAFDLCAELPSGDPKVLAAAGSGFAYRKRCAELGIDAIIAAPVDARELSDWLEHFEGHRAGDHAAVLIVDDDELAAEAVAALLASRGITAEIVADPTRVFDVLERHPFDLVLMDLNMPEANGIEVARMIRQDRRYLSIPVVFLASDDDTETQMRARRFGGDDFISKRVDPALLLRLVELRVDRARVIRALIERDGLTGLIDHQRFIERLGQELARSRRTGAECTLAMLDLDHFKAVNDTWGHQAGDLVLRRLATALTAWLRQTDVVGRYGGEEFGVLMLDTTPAQAAPVLDAFRRSFAALDIAVPGGVLRATFSAGVAGGHAAADAAALISAADTALYRAKSAGRDRVVVAEATPLSIPAAVSPPREGRRRFTPALPARPNPDGADHVQPHASPDAPPGA